MHPSLIKEFIKLSREIYGTDYVPLHRPIFKGKEREYLIECIDSNFVSSVGKRVSQFEQDIAKFTNSKFAIATVNGTSALHISLKLANVSRNHDVITQALTFIATCNAISYLGANPIFIDVDRDTLGLSPTSLLNFLENNAIKKDGYSYNKKSGNKISACVPMHTFGLPCRINEITKICKEWNIALIEDAAESLGSYVNNRHTGNFGICGTLSFNGNKIITTGGGGMIITNCEKLARKAKHITTTAKIAHPYRFIHDDIGYNYRMPNVNAALGCAQLEYIEEFLIIKKKISDIWNNFFKKYDIELVIPLNGSKANFWLNAIIFKSEKDKINFIEETNLNNIMTRPVWELMSKLKMFKNCQNDGLKNSIWLSKRVVNIPSSVPDIASNLDRLYK